MSFDFSVLFSLYNKENPAFLRQSLDSIFCQTLAPVEVILIKDGPLTDELENVISEYLMKYPVFKVIPLMKNQGLGKALNEGLKHCSCDLVARMDTDDIAKPNRFEKQIAVFEKYPDIDVISSWIEEFEGDILNISSVKKLPELHKDIFEYAKGRCPINHPVVMFKKNAVIRSGGYIHFPLFEDYYLWIRMLMNGAKFYNIQESLLYFRFSSDMFKRRGGCKYAFDELRFQNMMRHVGFISLQIFIRNITIRFMVRVLPNYIRALLYKKFLR